MCIGFQCSLRLRLRQRQPGEDAPGPAISIHHGLLDQHVLSNPRQQHRPYQVVQGAKGKDSNRYHAVQVVWELVVDALACGRWDVRRNHEVDVGEEKEDGDGEGRADPRGPVGETRGTGEIDPDETGGYERVDDGERVGDEAMAVSLVAQARYATRDILDQEVIGITWRRRQHNDNRHNVMLEQTGGRRVERAVAGQNLGEGQNTFTAQRLDNYLLPSLASINNTLEG